MSAEKVKLAGPMVASQSVGSASRRTGRSAREGATALQGRCSGSAVKRPGRCGVGGECCALVGPAGSAAGLHLGLLRAGGPGVLQRAAGGPGNRHRQGACPARVRGVGGHGEGRGRCQAGGLLALESAVRGDGPAGRHRSRRVTFDLRLDARLWTCTTPFVLMTPISRMRKRAR